MPRLDYEPTAAEKRAMAIARNKAKKAALAKMDISITGHRRLDRKLMKLQKRVAKKIIHEANKKGLMMVLAEAKSSVPKKTGAYRLSLKFRKDKSKNKHITRSRVVSTRKELHKRLETKIRSKNKSTDNKWWKKRKKGKFVKRPKPKKLGAKRGYYPAVLEFGAPKRGIVARHPLEKVFKATRRRAQKIIITELWAGIEREAKRK